MDLFERICEFLEENLTYDDLELLIPYNDSLRIWWSPSREVLNVDKLIQVLKGSKDYLSMFALVQFARLKGDLPKSLENDFTMLLMQTATSFRNSSFSQEPSFQVFLSYSHDDEQRVRVIRSILDNAGLKVFQDVEHIMPGESIVGALYKAMNSINRAVLIVSKNYISSEWTKKELDAFLNRIAFKDIKLFPILIDDIELPDAIKDVFTIDLRGFRGEADQEWAAKQLSKIVDMCLQNK